MEDCKPLGGNDGPLSGSTVEKSNCCPFPGNTAAKSNCCPLSGNTEAKSNCCPFTGNSAPKSNCCPFPGSTEAKSNCHYGNPRFNSSYRSNKPRSTNFRKSVDFLTTAPMLESKSTRTIPPGHECEEFFTSDNDPSFVAWQQKLHRERLAEAERLASLTRVPAKVAALPGHQGPTNIQTTSQEIGQYTDLVPRPPRRYPPEVHHPADPPFKIMVRFSPSNFSDHPPIPDHAFAVPEAQLVTPDGSRGLQGFIGANVRAEPPGVAECQPDSFTTSRLYMGRIVGERAPGEKFFPHLHPTGLEINRFNAGKGGDFKKWAFRGREWDLGHGTPNFPRRACTDVTRAARIM